ncbi:unnamed protein product [Trichobilharzia regenti]|nr:unnamed protein product [Trichobilharzia regenti]
MEFSHQTPRISRSAHSGPGRRRSAYSGFDDDSNDRQTSLPVFLCEFCGVRYRSRAGLNYHINSQHSEVCLFHFIVAVTSFVPNSNVF